MDPRARRAITRARRKNTRHLRLASVYSAAPLSGSSALASRCRRPGVARRRTRTWRREDCRNLEAAPRWRQQIQDRPTLGIARTSGSPDFGLTYFQEKIGARLSPYRLTEASHNGTLQVTGKGRYQVRLPLPQDV